MAKCKVKKPCYHCKEKKSHHRRLYPGLFKHRKPPSNSVFTANIVPPLVGDCDEGQAMLAWEQVITQAALFEAMDPDQSKSNITRILMDTGSQRNILLKKSSKKIEVITGSNVKLTALRLGASKPKEITTHIVTKLLKSKKVSTTSI